MSGILCICYVESDHKSYRCVLMKYVHAIECERSCLKCYFLT